MLPILLFNSSFNLQFRSHNHFPIYNLLICAKVFRKRVCLIFLEHYRQIVCQNSTIIALSRNIWLIYDVRSSSWYISAIGEKLPYLRTLFKNHLEEIYYTTIITYKICWPFFLLTDFNHF